jgi:hypothetical protein
VEDGAAARRDGRQVDRIPQAMKRGIFVTGTDTGGGKTVTARAR